MGWQAPSAWAAAGPPASSTEMLPSKPGTGVSLLAKTWPALRGNLVSRVKRLTTLRVATACSPLALPRSATLFMLTERSGLELF